MKKILKNTSLFIVSLVFTFSFGLNVKADACGELDNNRCRIGERGVIKVAGNGYKYQSLSSSTPNTREKVGSTNYSSIGVTAIFNGNDFSSDEWFTSYRDSYSSLFCLDSQYEGGSNVNAARFLLDTSENKRVQVFDAAVMSVLTDGGIHTGGSGDSNYWSKLLAIRALTYTFNTYNTGNEKYKAVMYSGFTVVSNWNKYYASEIGNLNSALKDLGASSVGGVSPHANYGFTGGPEQTAAGYYSRAIVAATEYAKTLKSQPEVQKSNPTAGEVAQTGGEGNVFVQKDVVHTIKVKGFNKSNKFVINDNGNEGIKFASGAQYDGLTAYISKLEISGGASYGRGSIPFGQDLVELGAIPENQDVEIKITAHFEGWKSSTNSSIQILQCGQSPIKYSIDGSYATGGQGEFSDYVATIWYSGEKESQRYIGVERIGEKRDTAIGTPWESAYETTLIDSCSCDDLIDACIASNNINSDACKELEASNCGVCSWYDASCKLGNEADCEKYTSECDLKCDTYFDTFECCDEKGDLIVSTLDDHEVSILGPGKDNPDAPSVKACFVNKVDSLALNHGDGTYKNNANIEGVKDQKGNTYTLSDMKSNSYCTVSCKEDYIMTMPTAKLVNAGRYFTFRAKVEGSKICYTDTIDRDKYNKDIIEKQEDMINAYNEYRKWYYLYRGEIKPVEGSYPGHSCSCDEHGCGPDCESTKYYPLWAAKATVPDWTDITAKPLSTGVVAIRQHAQEVNDSHEYEKPIGESTHTCPGGSWSCNCDDEGKNCETCRCSGGSATYFTDDEVVCDLNCYKAILKGNEEKARAALIAAEEAYRRVLKEYDECSNWKSEINYDPEVYYDYSEEDYMNMLSNRYGEMEKDVSSSSASEWYCNSRVTSGSGNEVKGQLSDQNYEQCNNASTGYHNTSLNYIYCDPNTTCKITPENVSDARYKKVTSGVSASYRPATLFYNVYPTGEITVNKADDNVALENKLPVALNRERGIYKYTVNIEDLGEFYDQTPKGNLGRYVGSTTAIVDPTTLVYNCSYLVNITRTTGWVCDFDDSCTDDCIANCVGPNCDDYCDGSDCVADCIGLGCIYDSGAGTSLLERLVSLNNLFPNGTDSYNWDRERNDKARFTISEIESKGNAIYDEEPILSITLTPSSAREIRKYNDSVINDGGYSNKTISCEGRGIFEEVVCYSSFIDDLLDGEYGDIVNDSLIADDGYRFGDSSGYFTLWGNAISEEDMIGPSWK